MQETVSLTVNGKKATATVEGRTLLVQLLREHLGLTGTHVGCEHGVCGACTVLLEGDTVRACLMFAVQADGCRIDTVEGLGRIGQMNALQRAFHEHHALQCGFCTPGMLVMGRDILLRFRRPDEKTVRHELSGQICRCTGYQGIVEAIVAAGEELAASAA